MATIYEFEIKCVSAFKAYPKEDIQKIIEDALKSFSDKETGLTLESVVVSPKKKTYMQYHDKG